MINAVPAILAFAIGACIGSFLNVCIARWPAEQSVVRPRSRCPGCGSPIAWYDNVPILSWIILRARCRQCGVPISVQYPLIELIVALGWVLAVLAFGPTFTALRIAIFGTVLLGIAMTDLKHYLIPDGFTIFGLVFVLGTSIISFISGDVSPFAEPWDALIGACTGAGAIAIVGWLGEATLKREAMGFGDVTLMAVIGAALGPARSLLVIFIGAALGALVSVLIVFPIMRLRKRVVIGDATATVTDAGETTGLPNVPFGVYLAPAALIVLFAGERIITWYLSRTPGGVP
ncbi:MAG TPA: prepilin peptidase [Gemmatimonadaceae bacterium]|nr:prepilin peptidase [Gemmatimonadaceae bacterium]